NPFVTSEVTLAVAVKLRSSIINLYFKDIQQLRDRLTFAGVYERLTTIASKVKLDEYPTSLALIEDLVQIIAVLERDYQSLFVDLVQDLILKIRMFNFYFAKLDIRQNSTIHKQVIAVMFKEHNVSFDYLSLSNEEKIALLKANLANLELITTQYQDPLVNEVLQTFKAIYQIQKNNGAAAIERYIISNTDSTASIFEVVFLIKLTNNYLSKIVQVPDDELIKLKVVPLFETIDDLKKAELIMEYLYSEPIYRQDLLQQQSMQTIMLGFSDGTKDGGYLRANWSIYLAKKKLTQVSHKHDIHVVFFDGRGGPPSRGGGNTYAFYHSLGTETEAREIQLTIQGQTISSNFGTTDSAIYNMEQLFTAGLVAKLFPSPTETLNAAQEELLEELAEVCYQAYLALRHDELFIPYLEEITPLKYLAAVNIGSRPAKRNSGNRLKLEDLRAIPFVGSWMQMQQNILGFYGLGIGMQSLINKNPTYLLKLQALYHDSLFFKTLINNAMESLYKSNFSISSHLAHDPKFGRFWHQLKDEHELAKTMLLLISGQSELLATDYVKRESINLRAKIKLPLLIIQQYALAKLRDPQLQDKEIWEKLITKSLAANVNASRNAI
ncbi:MAG: phosphoenolpyruvate carboxylase, partial [Burkholderiales bacterium]